MLNCFVQYKKSDQLSGGTDEAEVKFYPEALIFVTACDLSSS